MIRSGELRERVLIQRWTPSDDPQWGQSPGWVDSDAVWAAIKPLKADERSGTDGVQSSITHKIIIRYRPDLTSKDRLIWGIRKLDIVSVIDPDGRRAELLIEVKEHVEEEGEIQ